jgi:hypothetical protein
MMEIGGWGFEEGDLRDLQEAKRRLERPGVAARVAATVGSPIEAGLRHLPRGWNRRVGEATEIALFKGLEYAVRTMGDADPRPARNWLHKAAVVGSGAAAGAGGIYFLAAELPFSTCMMLRSIADIARSEGHDVSQLDTKLECLGVFALGGSTSLDDASETGYWTARAALARLVPEAVGHLTRQGAIHEGAPALVRLISAIGSRFSVVVTEELAAKAIPVLGAVSGAGINYLFMDHFQEMARGHFVVLRLERKYGSALVETVYREMPI